MNFADPSAVNESPPLEAAQLSDRYPGPVTDVLAFHPERLCVSRAIVTGV
jgi:hypothetical protein